MVTLFITCQIIRIIYHINQEDIFNLRCDLDFECNNPIFSQDDLAYDDVPSDQVWLPKISAVQKI